MPADKIRSVLFVCTGNSCRSVMAEGLLRKELLKLGKTGIDVHSAGVRAMGGFSPTPETIEVMKAEGVDVSGQTSTPLTDELIRRSDLILVMEHSHKIDVQRKVPEAKEKTFLLKEYRNKGISADDAVIEDPIGMPMDFYNDCMADIKKHIERIAKTL